MNKNLKKSFLAIATTTLLLGVVGCTSNNLVAKVGDDKITKDDLYDEMVGQAGGSVLERMIENLIIENEIKKEKINISKEVVDEEYNKTVEYYGGDENLENALQSNGMTVEELRKDMEMNLAIEEILLKEIEVTEEEVKNYFEENKDLYNTPEQISASHILVDDEKTAKEVKEKINKGGSFEALVSGYSTDEAAGETGNLGYFGKGSMVPEFEEVAFAMEIGDISEPVKTNFGFHIIKLNDKKAASKAKYDEVKNDVKESLLNEKLNAQFSVWMKDRRSEYKIETFLD